MTWFAAALSVRKSTFELIVESVDDLAKEVGPNPAGKNNTALRWYIVTPKRCTLLGRRKTIQCRSCHVYAESNGNSRRLRQRHAKRFWGTKTERHAPLGYADN